MRVIPAIDLQNGKCVRLYQGDFEQVTEYSDDPVAVARGFSGLAVSELHIVDLDGARTGEQANTDAIRRISHVTPFRIQLGGGIRYAAVIEHWLDNGVERCVLGSLAVEKPETVMEWIRHYGADRIVLAFDVAVSRGGTPTVATRGWTKTSTTTLWDCLDRFRDAGLVHVLCTDISRDGVMSGPNVDLYREIMAAYPDMQLQASGGVRNAADLRTLERIGVPAVITGTALLDGSLNADEVASFRRSE